MRINHNANFANLSESYLFSEINRRVRAYQAENPDKEILRLGIGDVTLPLPEIIVNAMHTAVAELGVKETFRGYPPEYGYDFLRSAVSRHYAEMGVTVSSDDIFISDGAKSDCGNIVDILGDNQVYMPDPVYPVYMDSNVMSGRSVQLFSATWENGFLPMPDEERMATGVYYLCSPNNPTGATYSLPQLQQWVDFANKSGSLIIFDAAYEAFITDDSPRSVFCADGSETCAIEICSFSKTAGFTGTRCGYTVVPAALQTDGVSLRKLWMRRQATKFNGVSYPVQRAAEAAYSPAGMAALRENLSYYQENAMILSQVLDTKKIAYCGGKNSPYLWMKCPEGMDSWTFFDDLLQKIQVVGTPGAGFGASGEGYFRLTSFGSRETTAAATERLKGYL